MKIRIGDKKRVFIGSWVIAALLLLAYNVYALMSVLGLPLFGHSEEVKRVRQQYQQFMAANTGTDMAAFADADLDQVLARLIHAVHKHQKTNLVSLRRKVKAVGKPKLPKITGVLQISDIQGNSRMVAVIDGRRLGEEERVQGFTVREITKQGAILARGGSSWFVPAPKGQFTVVRAD